MTTTNAYFVGKVSVVTGGASGVGLALAEGMLDSGASRVVLADVNQENLDQQRGRLVAIHPGRVLGLRTDVTSEP